MALAEHRQRGSVQPLPALRERRVDAKPGAFDHPGMVVEAAVRKELRKCLLQHCRSGRGKKSGAADDLSGIGDRKNLGRAQCAVLIPLASVLDIHVPAEPACEDPGT